MVRRAALFGCNYAGTNNALHGCINDVRAVHEMLVQAYQFNPQVTSLAAGSVFLPSRPCSEAVESVMVDIVMRSHRVAAASAIFV